MTFEPLRKGMIIIGKIYEDSAFETYIPVVVEHEVRSAVEGREVNLRALMLDDNATVADYKRTIKESYDKWFPVFVEDSHSHHELAKAADRAESVKVNKDVSAATESVANSEGRQQSMATCCRQQSEGSSPSPSSSLSQPQDGIAGLQGSSPVRVGGAGELSGEGNSCKTSAPQDVKHAARKGCTCARCSHLNHVVHDDCGCECHKKEGEEK